MEVSPTQLSVLRMIPLARRIARASRGEVAVYRLLNSARGWDTRHTPVQDARWALQCIRDELGPVPVALVGHSLGGRAALLAAHRSDVRAVVALNPYLHGSDGDADLSGTDVRVVHGTADRIARLSVAEQVVARLRRRSNTVELVRVEGGKHAMLRHHRRFADLTTDFLAQALVPSRR